MEQEKTVKESYYCNVFADAYVGSFKYDSFSEAKTNRYYESHYKGVINYIVWSDGSVETHYIPD